MESDLALPPEQLADLLRPFIPPDERPTLEALLKKAQHNDHVCDICYANAQAEGATEALTLIQIEPEPVLGFCPHGKNLDTEFCPAGCRV